MQPKYPFLTVIAVALVLAGIFMLIAGGILTSDGINRDYVSADDYWYRFMNSYISYLLFGFVLIGFGGITLGAARIAGALAYRAGPLPPPQPNFPPANYGSYGQPQGYMQGQPGQQPYNPQNPSRP